MSVRFNEITAPGVSAFAASNQNFSASLFKAMTDGNTPQNAFLSPLCIHLCLFLTLIGAKGKTSDELKSGLRLPQDDTAIWDSVQKLVGDLEKPQLHSASEIFLDQQYSVKQEYLDKSKKYLKAGSQTVPFKTDSTSALATVNNFVSNKTNNKINDFLKKEHVNQLTKLILVNAVHFKDVWKVPFTPELTKLQNFHTTKDKSVSVPFLTQYSESYKYYEADSYKAVEIPYAGDQFKMVIVLPKEIDGLQSLQNQIHELNVAKLVSEKMRVEDVNLSIPKFKLEQEYDLTPALSKLGINVLFSDEADLTGIHEPSELKVDKVLHKSFVEVNEEGTEAAAATGVIIAETESIKTSPPPKEFNVDRPFLFNILFGELTIFMGTVANF